MSYDRPHVKLIQIVAAYIAGEVIGALTQSVIGDVLGRKRFMGLMCVIVGFVCLPICALAHILQITIGTTIQTAAQDFGMFLAGRILTGVAA